MNKFFFIFLLAISLPVFVTSQNFTGYYIEYIEKGKKGDITTFEYLIEENKLQSHIQNFYFKNDTLKMIFNYSSFYFERIPKEHWPEGCHNQDCIDWNMKVSLHRSNYKSQDRIYLLTRTKNNDFKVALHIKKVSLDIEYIGNLVELRNKKFRLQYIGGVGSGYLGTSSNYNYLLRKIYAQKVLNELDIELLGLDKHLKLLDIKKANNDFHPHFTDDHLVKEKRKKAKFDCFCDEYFPSNR